MAIDIREISLTDEQKRRVAQIAELSGRSWSEILDEKLGEQEVTPPSGVEGPHKDRYIEDQEKWLAYFREWLAKQTSHNPNFDDSRESIYF